MVDYFLIARCLRSILYEHTNIERSSYGIDSFLIVKNFEVCVSSWLKQYAV